MTSDNRVLDSIDEIGVLDRTDDPQVDEKGGETTKKVTKH